MVVDAEPLAKLRDIHLPAPISWWPLAPGWYLLALVGLFSVVALILVIRRHYLGKRAKLASLRLLSQYYEEYQRGATSQETSMKISELLRRVAMVYFPREQIASLQGRAWLDFLARNVRGADFYAFYDCLLELPYQPAKEKDLQAFFSGAKIWIKERRKPCLN